MFRKFTSERVRKQRRRKTIILSSIYTLLAVSIFLVVWQVTYTPLLRINTVHIEGNSAVDEGEIFNLVKEDLSGSYWHLFSKRNSFLYPKSAIESHILNEFHRVKKVSLDLERVHTLEIVLEERKEDAMVCGKNTGECYFLDKEGIIFVEAPKFSGNSYIRYSMALPENPLSMYMIRSEKFDVLQDFIGELSKLSFRVTDVEIFPDHFDIVAKTQFRNDVDILVSRTRSFEETLLNLNTLLNSDDFEGETSLSTLDSIDLRFGNKIFFEEGAPSDLSAPKESSSQLTPL